MIANSARAEQQRIGGPGAARDWRSAALASLSSIAAYRKKQKYISETENEEEDKSDSEEEGKQQPDQLSHMHGDVERKRSHVSEEGDIEAPAAAPPLFMDVGPGGSSSNKPELVDTFPASNRSWSWIEEYDELSQGLCSNELLCGFTEDSIHFPPSYRWNRHAGKGVTLNFTDVDCLNNAYSIRVAGGNPFAETTSLRTPSYTDRILSFSLPSKSQKLQSLYYDMMEEVVGGDHKPVIGVFSLGLNRGVIGFGLVSR